MLTENNGSSHYSSIKNLDGLLRAQYTKSGSNKRFHCYRCLHGFKAKKGEKTRDQCKNLQEHISYCKSVDPQLVSYPKNEVAEFTNLRKMLKAPVVCYADFMSILEKTGDIDTTTGIQDKPDNSKHTKYQAHKPVSYFKKVVSVDPSFQLDQEIDFQFPQKDAYIGEDCVSHFLDYMTKLADKTYDRLFGEPSEMIFTENDKETYETATECHICDKKYSSLRAYPHAHKPGDDIKRCEMCIINEKLESKKFTLPIYHCHNENENEKSCIPAPPIKIVICNIT